MQYRELGHSGLKVSQHCLGTMTWGRQNTEAEGFAQMDYALDQGINFFDTAEMYAVPPTAESYGRTETIIGNWFRARGSRDRVILASKVVGRAPGMPWIRDGKARLDRANIEAALDGSLRRLQTDYIDLYQLHWPDRPANRFGQLGYRYDAEAEAEADPTPIEETLAVLADLVRAGKVRHIGLSNDTPWGVMRFVQLAEQAGWPRVVSVQNPYNLLNRAYEVGLAEISMREQCGLLAYSPLGGGYLSGKYLNGQIPPGTRRSIDTRPSRYDNPESEAAITAYLALARAHDLDPCQMALAFVDRQPFVTANILGATSMDQLTSNIAASALNLSDEVIAGIEAIHRQHPNPAP